MNLLCKNISLNLSRVLNCYYEEISYFCSTCIRIFHSNNRNSFRFLAPSGERFFYLRFRVSKSGLRYAHKIPVLAEFQDKRSTLENFPQCMQCPKPDNMRPNKAIFITGKSLKRNNSLSLGRLVCYNELMPVCNPKPENGFYREKGLCLN